MTSFWRWRKDSNPQSSAYKAVALPILLLHHVLKEGVWSVSSFEQIPTSKPFKPSRRSLRVVETRFLILLMLTTRRHEQGIYRIELALSSSGGNYRTRTYILPVNSRLLHRWAKFPHWEDSPDKRITRQSRPRNTSPRILDQVFMVF